MPESKILEEHLKVLLKASCTSQICEDLATGEEKNLWRLGNSKPCFAASL